MADSEISRTLPAITRGKDNPQNGTAESLPRLIDRRNLLPVAARWLTARINEARVLPRESGPTPVREMWPRWYACHRECLQATRLRQQIEATLLQETGGPPTVELPGIGTDKALAVRSIAEINRLTSQMTTEQLCQARFDLRQRQKQWRDADRRLGYSAAVTRERELLNRAGISGRVIWITAPSSLVEVTAKLHCLIVMHDPGLKLETTPWPELRRLLKDLVRIGHRA